MCPIHAPDNQLLLFTREYEDTEGEDASCGRNPDGCSIPGVFLSGLANGDFAGGSAKSLGKSGIPVGDGGA